MRYLSRLLMAAGILAACSTPVLAADKLAAGSQATDHARTRLTQIISDAKAELAQAALARASDVQALAAAQAEFESAAVRAQSAQDVSMRLNATAQELRRQAYAISDLPGLSAEQNHRSVAAMEAADAAENAARVAQFSVATTSAAANASRVEIARLTTHMAELDGRIAACNQLVALNAVALHTESSASTRR